MSFSHMSSQFLKAFDSCIIQKHQNRQSTQRIPQKISTNFFICRLSFVSQFMSPQSWSQFQNFRSSVSELKQMKSWLFGIKQFKYSISLLAQDSTNFLKCLCHFLSSGKKFFNKCQLQIKLFRKCKGYRTFIRLLFPTEFHQFLKNGRTIFRDFGVHSLVTSKYQSQKQQRKQQYH
jgi:hypothetical protein